MASKWLKTDNVTANHKIDDGTRHYYLARRRGTFNTLCRVNCSATDIIASEFYFPGVKPCPNSDTG